MASYFLSVRFEYRIPLSRENLSELSLCAACLKKSPGIVRLSLILSRRRVPVSSHCSHSTSSSGFFLFAIFEVRRVISFTGVISFTVFGISVCLIRNVEKFVRVLFKFDLFREFHFSRINSKFRKIYVPRSSSICSKFPKNRVRVRVDPLPSSIA